MIGLRKPRPGTQVMADTSYWMALVDKRDQNYQTSLELKRDINDFNPAVTEYIVDETTTLVNRRLGIQKALSVFQFLTTECYFYWLEPVDFWKSQEVFKSYKGAFSFTDAAIIRCMQKEGLRYLVSFDSQFDRVPWLTRIHMPGQLQA